MRLIKALLTRNARPERSNKNVNSGTKTSYRPADEEQNQQVDDTPQNVTHIFGISFCLSIGKSVWWP